MKFAMGLCAGLEFGIALGALFSVLFGPAPPYIATFAFGCGAYLVYLYVSMGR
jgi:xanthosine utilization system XapX-like protein